MAIASTRPARQEPNDFTLPTKPRGRGAQRPDAAGEFASADSPR